jgi:Tol biopolymer transport system component
MAFLKRFAQTFLLCQLCFVVPGKVDQVTIHQGTNLAVTATPAGDKIVFALQGALWSLPSGGGAAKRLTDPLLEPSRPDYSRQGDAIVFQAYKAGTFHIWTIRPDGSGLRQLTEGHGDDREPRWSPDGTKVAFASDRAFKGSYDIWVVEVASGKLTQWTSSAEDEYEPAWSPGGTEIAFVSGTGTNGTSIQAVHENGERRTLITAPAGAHLDSPSWSVDGAKVSYTQLVPGKSELFVSGAHVGTAEDVFPFPATWIAGGKLLYAADGQIQISTPGSGNTIQVPFSVQFALHRAAYRHKHFVLEPAAAKPTTGIVGPVLSPNGKQIVFQALNQIWLLNVGNGKPRQLTDDPFYKEDPAWSPDGKRIAFSSDKAGTEDIYLLDPATAEEQQLTNSADSAEVSAAWSPDGKQLAFQDQTGATYVIDLETRKQKKVIDAQFAPSKPSWGKDGRSLSIGALKPYTKRFREGTSQILTVDLATGKLTYSEPTPFGSLSTRGEDGPIYSPDRSTIAFVEGSELWIRPVNEDGVPEETARRVNREVTDAPTWSSDSKHLLYLSNGRLRFTDLNGTASTIPLDLSWRAAGTPQPVLVHAGRLWNGRGEAVQSDVDILIEGRRIRSIRPHSSFIPPHVRVIDAAQWTAIPGLWESHTHEWISGKFYGDRLGRLWLAYGVTSLQSQGDPAYRALETREAFASGARVGPRFFASGEAIDGERIYYNFMRPTTSEEQLRLELERAKALDYDNLKTYVRLPHAMQQEVAQFGHQQMGVVTASHYMLPGLSYGVDGMTHISATSRLGYAETRTLTGKSYEDVRQLFATSGAYVISTPFYSFPLYRDNPQMVEDQRLLDLNTPWDQQELRLKRDVALGKHPKLTERLRTLGGNPAITLISLAREEATVVAVRRSGGMVLAGTDSPIDNVATALHLNLRAQVKYGLKPWEALQSATLLPAQAFGLSADLGTIEAGKLADLVLVSGNPLENIDDAANVQLVIKGGQVYTIPELTAPFRHSPEVSKKTRP